MSGNTSDSFLAESSSPIGLSIEREYLAFIADKACSTCLILAFNIYKS